jgi:hypothetical protein
MPYVTCARCGLTAFSAARWSSVEHCAGCGSELPHPRRGDSAPFPIVPAPPLLRSRRFGVKSGWRA